MVFRVVSSGTGTSVEVFGFAVAAETLSTTIPSLISGQLIAAPTATPHPNVLGKKYVDNALGFGITPPDGWVSEPRDDGLLIYDPYSETYILITISYDLSSGYNSTTEFTNDYIVAASENWNNFQIQSELNLTRYSYGGSKELIGRQFSSTFSTGTGDEIENFIGTTQWFVIAGWLYDAQLIAPIHGSNTNANSALNSFRPFADPPTAVPSPTPQAG